MIIEKENILLNKECNEIIELASLYFSTAKVLGDNVNYKGRVAENSYLSDNLITSRIKKIVFEHTNLPIENMEKLCVIKYNIGGEYQNHQDFFHPSTSYYDNIMLRGGQRVKTAMFYLNDNFAGGETNFPKLNIKIIPKLGKMVIWDNILPSGELNYDSMHAGLPVISGIKYICTVWIRESKFK